MAQVLHICQTNVPHVTAFAYSCGMSVTDDIWNMPFVEAIDALLRDYGWSQRELGRRLDEKRGTTSGYMAVTQWRRGNIPTVESIVDVAEIFDVDPRCFANYRISSLAEALDIRKVGFQSALLTYQSVTGDVKRNAPIAAAQLIEKRHRRASRAS